MIFQGIRTSIAKKPYILVIFEALPGVLGNRGKRIFIPGEQGNNGQILRGTREPRQFWVTGNIRKQIFDFWETGEHANLFQGNKGKCTPLGGPHFSGEGGPDPLSPSGSAHEFFGYTNTFLHGLINIR